MKDIKNIAKSATDKFWFEFQKTGTLRPEIITKLLLYFYELATEWNSPDEKPEKDKDDAGGVSTLDVIIKLKGKKFFAYYSYQMEQWYLWFDLKHRVEVLEWVDKIDGWQYLPK